MGDQVVLDWLRAVHPTTRYTTSVCTGSLVLGAAGLLNGLTATTHWSVLNALEALGATPTSLRVVEHLDQRIITAAGVSSGIRVLRAKHRTAPHGQPWDLGVAIALTMASVGMAVWGLSSGRPLFTAFSAIGLFSGIGQLFYWRRVPTEPMHWWFQHMGSMLGSCIAATTAFLVINAGRLGFETFALAVWLVPTVIGVPTIAIWTAYYRRKFAGTTRARVPVSGARVAEG